MRLRQVGGAIMVVALAGCGSATALPSAGRAGEHPGARAGSARHLGPRAGSPALARAVDRRMLAVLVLPAGAKRIGARSWPPRAESIGIGIGNANLVDVSRFFRLPQSPGVVYAFLHAHVPPGTKFVGDGSGFVPKSGSEQDVSYSLTSPPAGIEQDNMLDVNLVAGSRGGTVLRADAEVVWYPARSAAEFIRAARFRVVTVTAGYYIRPQRYVSRTETFTSPAVISRLARLLNGLHAIAPATILCPDHSAQVGVRFATAPGRRAIVVVSPASCVSDLVTVRGKPQPALEDFGSSRLLALVRSLLGRPHAHK